MRKRQRKPVRPKFKIDLRFPDGLGMTVESIREHEFTPESWCLSALANLTEYAEHVRRYQATLVNGDTAKALQDDPVEPAKEPRCDSRPQKPTYEQLEAQVQQLTEERNGLAKIAAWNKEEAERQHARATKAEEERDRLREENERLRAKACVWCGWIDGKAEGDSREQNLLARVEATEARETRLREALQTYPWKSWTRQLRVDASGEDGRMDSTAMYALADAIDAVLVSGGGET